MKGKMPNEFDPIPAVRDEAEAGRSAKVREYLENIKQSITTINFDAGELLAEATEKNYFSGWGYESRKAYVTANLDMSDRNADYLIRIVTTSKAMNYQRHEIEGLGISKLREIFSLNPDGFFMNPETMENEPLSDHIRRLVVIGPTTGYEAILLEVKRLKGRVGENDLTWTNFQTTRLTKENVIEPGLEAFRQYLGSKGVHEKEGSTEYSDGFTLEMMCAEVLSGAPSGAEEFKDERETVPNESDFDADEAV
jgi:hypothetical protein